MRIARRRKDPDVAVDYELTDSVARVYLNRPHRLNAVVPELVTGLITAFGRAGSDGARVVVLAGRGRAFCSGHDLKEQLPPETVLATRLRVDQIQEVTRAIRRFPGPVIAAVHGYALGAGCEFALGCDLVVAAEDAQFGFPEVSVGLSVTGGISRLLPLLVGPVRAKELLLVGERFGAARALELGLINQIAPAGEHEKAAPALPARLPDPLTAAVRAAAQRWPHPIAWRFDPGDELTFADVDRLTAGYAQTLRDRGVRAGDRVAVLLGNEAAFPLTWLALSLLGAAAVPVNTKYQTADASHVLRACRASAIVAGARFAPLLERLPSDVPALRLKIAAADLAGTAARASASVSDFGYPNPAGTANIQFTSGTTGRPKGCILSHRYWTQLGGSLVTDFPYLSERDVMLTAQPCHYIDPQWNVAAALLAGAELVVLDGFPPSSFWAKVREHRVTYFYCLGAMPALLLRMPADDADRDHLVRAVQCSAIPPALHATLEQRWGVPWYETFGMTETGADLRVTDADHDELVGTGCLGRPTSHRKVQITGDDGQPVLAGQTGE